MKSASGVQEFGDDLEGSTFEVRNDRRNPPAKQYVPYSSTLAPASSPDPLFPCHTCLLLFLLILTIISLHFGSARRRHCGLDPRSSSVLHSRHHIHTTESHSTAPPPTVQYHRAVQSNHAHCRISSKAQSLACWISRHALQMPFLTQSASINNHHCQTATTRRPAIGPANGPRLIFSSSTPPNVSISVHRGMFAHTAPRHTAANYPYPLQSSHVGPVTGA